MASAPAEVDSFNKQQSSSSSVGVSSGLGTTTPAEDELLIIRPNDATLVNAGLDIRATHTHESAAMAPQAWVS
jgi:hypothetical protein